MLSRQRVALSFLWRAGGVASRIRVTKWLFLLRHETTSRGGEAFYDFLPYRFGPYSFTLGQEMASLAREGLLAESSNEAWRLTDAGRQEALNLPSHLRPDVDSIFQRYGRLTNPQLLDSVYARYPWYAINSELRAKRSIKPATEPAVFTIGYEGLQVDALLNQILLEGIVRLIDVRNNPVSRRYGYHAATLSRLCERLDIEYRNIPELGIPSSDRSTAADPLAVQSLLDRYESTLAGDSSSAVERLAEDMASRPSVLLCRERTPDLCHRGVLARSVAPLAHLPVRHLGVTR